MFAHHARGGPGLALWTEECDSLWRTPSSPPSPLIVQRILRAALAGWSCSAYRWARSSQPLNSRSLLGQGVRATRLQRPPRAQSRRSSRLPQQRAAPRRGYRRRWCLASACSVLSAQSCWVVLLCRFVSMSLLTLSLCPLEASAVTRLRAVAVVPAHPAPLRPAGVRVSRCEAPARLTKRPLPRPVHR